MGEACDTYVGEQKCIQNFGRNLKQRDPLEVNTKMDLRETGREDVDGD